MKHGNSGRLLDAVEQTVKVHDNRNFLNLNQPMPLYDTTVLVLLVIFL